MSGSSTRDFNFIVDRMKQKLAGWKASLLSQAGRAVLVQSSLSTIPNYVMQCTYLPAKVLDSIDWVNKNFLWGFTESSRKMHWIGWEKVTKSKEEGGLGLQTAKGRNTSLLAKLNWRFQTEGDSLCAKVIKSKYCSQQRLRSRNSDKLSCSQVWVGMRKAKTVFQNGTRWFPGRESNLNFWFDSWTSLGPLRQVVQGPLPLESEKLKIRDAVDESGWN